jgi:PilZ domain
MSDSRGVERRRHVRVDGTWPVTAHVVDHAGAEHSFPATILNVALGGVLVEAAITANLWADRQLDIDLPGGVGRTRATVRRFVEYGEAGARTSRWGVELTDLTVVQRALWGRFVYTTARATGHALAGLVVRVAAPAAAAPRRSALAAAYSRRI